MLHLLCPRGRRNFRGNKEAQFPLVRGKVELEQPTWVLMR